jgi:hypothetical protein
MTLKSYLWGMRIIALVSLAALAVVVFCVDPDTSGTIGKSIFYFVLFFAFSGILNLFLIFSRRKIMGGETALATIGLSFRQSILLSLLVVGLMIFQSFRILVWWDGLLLAAGIFIIELYFLSRK